MKTPFTFLALILFLIPNLNFGQAPSLGVANSFAVFTAVGAFSNLGATVVTGDIGTDVGSFSGFPPGVVMGSIHVADPVADQAAIDVASAYMALDGQTCNTVLGVTLGGGQMLTPDIYCIGAAATLNGTLVLDGAGDPNSLFIFQIDGALATGTLANVVLINGASICNVWWQVNGAFTLGDGSVFRGNVLANGAIHLLEASSLFGRALSQGGAIDLHNNVISIGLPPIAAVIAANGPTTFCVGDSVTLSGNIDGVWNNGSVTPSIVVTTAGDYFVVNTTLCGSDTSNHILVSLNPDNPPTITCPTDLTVTCASLVPAPNIGSVSASDDCGGIAVVTFGGDVISAQTCANRFSVTRTYIATDATGNTTVCSQTITVFDNTAPTITCPANLTFQCASQVPIPNIAGIVAADNCTGEVIINFVSDVITNQTCVNRFTVNRVYSATDACGNSSTCTQTITVFDNTPPSIACPANITVLCAGQVPAANPAGFVTADNCGGVATVIFLGDVITNQICADRYTLTRTYRATDACGNFFDCNQTITVFDNTLPSITCPGNVTVQCVNQIPAVNPASIVTADNCGPTATVTFLSDVITNQTCANHFTLTRTYRSTDACGNINDCSQTITIFDNTPPAVTCPGNVTVQCASQVPAPNPSTIVSLDNCGGLATVVFVNDVISGQTCANRFNINRTYLAVDACGNTAVCAHVITVFDNTPPSITCPVNVTVLCANQVPVANAAGIVTADNCGGTATVTFAGDIISNFVCTNQFVVNRTYLAV
ncbi:MAG: DUF3494 domain-containing protein [Saprospiraceae bacterium]|uniref:DUF3494 domain-containing protein n=1 Tax=Candidatus Opimibacter skivensis TaxID=2982028 RepID=A0A9D7T0Q2_9BACT|nr:DUF3494 domain-containing protein [Candidatus Opimibacter skivensis]